MERRSVNAQDLINTARALVADDKGPLAMGESNPTCDLRFARVEIPRTVEARRAWRELIIATLGLGESISGAILYAFRDRMRRNVLSKQPSLVYRIAARKR